MKQGNGIGRTGMKVVVGCGIALGALTYLPSAAAQSKTLYVGMNGGVMERTYVDHVFPAFEKENNVKVVVVPGTSSDILAKVQASKDKPQMHIIFLDDGVMYRAISMGLCDKLADSPELKDIPATGRIKGNMAAAVSIGMTGLAYNTKMFKEKGWAAPTSWQDLADPKFKGKVIFQSLPSSTFGLHAFLMVNRLNGGTESNVEPGFKAWKTGVGANVGEYVANSAKLSEMVQTGEAGLFPSTPTQVMVLKGKGLPVEYAQPKEGAVALNTMECVIARNDEPALAQKLAAFLLSPGAQAKALQGGGSIPANPKTPLPADTDVLIKHAVDYARTAVVMDWDVINAQRPAWSTRWNKTVER